MKRKAVPSVSKLFAPEWMHMHMMIKKWLFASEWMHMRMMVKKWLSGTGRTNASLIVVLSCNKRELICTVWSDDEAIYTELLKI